MRFDRSFLAIATAAEGLGAALESTLLAERELASGRLVAPLAGRANDIRYVGANRDRALGEADRTGRHYDETSEEAVDEGSAASVDHEAD